MAGTFVDKLTTLMPAGVTLAPELVQTFDWMEDQDWLHIRDGGTPEDHWLSIYPPEIMKQNFPNASLVGFGGTTLPYTGHWSTPDPAVDARIVEIATTSGDGGRAAIWVDDAGKQWFVHLGHDVIGVISDDPVVLLQWLAMGYGEPGAMEATDLTPLQLAMEYNGVETEAELAEYDALPLMPEAFQAYLHTTFGRELPATARALGIADFTYYGDPDSTDPFVRWLASVTPPPTEEELAYIAELEKMAAEMTFDDLTLEDPDKPTGILGKLKGLFGSNK